MENETPSRQKRILLWSTPRSLSSAMCRVMMNSGYSTQVLFEPYGYPYFFGPERVGTRFKELKPDPSFTYSNALKSLQMPYSDKELVFAKILPGQMEPHWLSSEWIPDGYLHTFSTRHPRKTALSVSKVLDPDLQERYNYGYKAQVCILRQLQQLGHKVVILDADDILSNPEGMLRAYCREVDLEFRDSMIHWNPLSEEEAESVFRTSFWEPAWLDNVTTATGLQARQKEISEADYDDSSMDPRQRNIIEKCVQENMKYYKIMSDLCLKI